MTEQLTSTEINAILSKPKHELKLNEVVYLQGRAIDKLERQVKILEDMVKWR